MSLKGLFNIAVTSAPRVQQKFGPEIVANGTGEVDQSKSASVGAFVTPQTLVTFPGATGVIAAIWAAANSFGPFPKRYDLLIGAALSVMVGIVIYAMSDIPSDRKSRIAGVVIAVINTILLFNAARAMVGP